MKEISFIVTTSLEPSGSGSEIVPLQWESVVAGNSPLFHNVSRVVSCCAMFTKVCAASINYLEIS